MPQEEELPDVPRSAEEIARRVLVLSTAIGCAFGADKRAATMWLHEQGQWHDVSPDEQGFLSGEHTPQQQVNMSWRIEALVPLLWALRKIDLMPSFARQFDTTAIHQSLVLPPSRRRTMLGNAPPMKTPTGGGASTSPLIRNASTSEGPSQPSSQDTLGKPADAVC